ncbi:MAG: hypothetical protein ACHQXA_09725 [Gemmatimonadales bacterium]
MSSAPRSPWIPPVIEVLPRLTELTLLSPIGGGGGTGGSTVFGLLLAAGLLFGIGACSDEIVRPSTKVPAAEIQTVSCQADVRAGTLRCARPAAAGPVVLGGQGTRVALRSTNVAYGAGIFSADVTVQNLLAQSIGTDGLGVDVFFVSGPVVTAGTGTVTVANATGTNTFTAPGQSYFRYVNGDSLTPGQTSSALNWQWNVPLTATSFSFTVLVSASVRDDQGVLLWSRVPQFATDSFTDIAVNSATDAMAVGPKGVVYRKVGTTWEHLSAQTTEDWVGVAAIGNGEYVGATAQGTVALFNGQVWNTVRNAGFNVKGITAYAANRIAIGGDSGGSPRLSWLGNSGWFSIGLGGGGTFAYAESYGSNQGVGGTTDGSVYRFNFNAQAPSGTSADSITTMYGAVGKGDFGRGVFQGGFGAIVDDGSGNIYNPGADTAIDAIDFGSGGPNLWASVRNVATDSSVLLSWTGGIWSTRAGLPKRVTKMVQDSSGGLYLLSADGIRRWNGSTIVDELVGPQSTFPTAIGGNGSAAFVGMNNGDIRRYHGTTWTTANPGGFLRVASLAVFSGGTAAALDTAGQFSIWDGSSWSFAPTFANARAIWGIDTTHMVMLEYNPALSGTSYVSHGYPFGSFAPTANPGGVNTPLNAVWGMSDTDFWIVGNGGVVLHYNGTSYTSFAPGTSEDLLATTGTGNSDLWVAGTGGYLAHWNGSAWTSCGGSLGSSTVTSLWAVGAGAAYAGQANGAVTLVDAPCTPVAPRTIPGSSGAVSTLSGASATDLWALVGTGIFHGTR